jgi:hypothetical protein
MARLHGVSAHAALTLALLTVTRPAAASCICAPRPPEPASDYIRAAVPVADSGLAIVRALSMVVAM